MFSINNSPNMINDEPNGIARSISAARFQIEKVSNEDPNSQKLSCEITNIPAILISSISCSSSPNEIKKKVLFGDDSSEHSSTISDINQTITLNNGMKET
ncbi:unnamed protein product, partial [Rotaria sp. Silwood2]